MPALTIGMAHFDDFDGVYFTIQSLRLNNPQLIRDIEFVVVDNSPDTSSGKLVNGFVVNNAGVGAAGARYVAMSQPIGTSVSRQKIFDEATGDFVLVLDCHVLLAPDALSRLFKWYQDHPGTNDLYSGPLILDSLAQFTTHFNDEWRAEMWGTWGNAWRCGCSNEGLTFTTINQDGKLAYRLLAMGQTPVTMCGKCDRSLPLLDFPQHEQHLVEGGYVRLGSSADHSPFEIPGMGLGLFSCRKEAWPGFNAHARGFGGEELYIHEKFRQRGGKAICLPWLGWVHRFGRKDGVRYPLTRWNKLRNYVLEFQELGLDLAPIHDHFVTSKLVSESAWKYLLEDPIARVEEPSGGCNTCGGQSKSDPLAEAGTIDEVYAILQQIPRDLDQHMETLTELASKVDHVTEVSKRRESTVALLAGRPQKMVSYQVERDPILARLPDMTKNVSWQLENADSTKIEVIEETDLLFIDSTRHTFNRLTEELNKFAPRVRRYIACHDTKLHAERGEDGGPGLLAALRAYMREHPEWSVVDHTDKQYGLTILSKLASDKPQLPSTLTMAKNLAKALASHVAQGGGDTTEAELESRLNICSACTHRSNDRCSVCGCFLTKKASLRTQPCPLGKWPELGPKDGV